MAAISSSETAKSKGMFAARQGILSAEDARIASEAGADGGVGHAIDLLAAEVSRNMAMLGVNHLTEIDRTRHLTTEPPGTPGLAS